MGIFDRFLHPPSEEQFARRVIRELSAAGDRRVSQFDARQFRLCFSQDGRQVGVANLRNLYEEYVRRRVTDRARFLKQAVRSLLASYKSLPADFDDARPDLLPALRNRSYFTTMELQRWAAGDTGFDWPHLVLGEHLAVGLVFDLPEAMVAVQQDQLDTWYLSFYEALEVACENLSQLDVVFGAMNDQLFVSATEDNYDASRLAMPELVRELEVQGQHIAMIPHRDKLLVTGSENRSGIETMALLAAEALRGPRPLSGFAFCLDGDHWKPWLPSPAHPAFGILRRLRLRSLRQDYAVQQPLLTSWYRQQGLDTFVSSFELDRPAGSRQLISYCECPPLDDVVLPCTDMVLFLGHSLRGRPRPLRVTWDAMQQVLGPLLQPQEFYPECVRLHGRPTPSQWRRLNAAAQNVRG